MSTVFFRALVSLLSLALVSLVCFVAWTLYNDGEQLWWAHAVGVAFVFGLLAAPLFAAIDFLEALLVSADKLSWEDIKRWDREVEKHEGLIKLSGLCFFVVGLMWIAAQYGGWKPTTIDLNHLDWWFGGSALLLVVAFGVNPLRLGKLEKLKRKIDGEIKKTDEVLSRFGE